MTTYEKILAIRNEKIPQRLEFGCEVKTRFKYSCNPAIFNPKGEDRYFEENIIVYKYKEKDDPESFNKIKTICDCNGYVYEDIDKIDGDYEIIGKPVSLNDVLMLLEGAVFEVENSRLFVYEDFSYFEYLIKNCVIDLSKEIKEQDDEVLDEIYKLIK